MVQAESSLRIGTGYDVHAFAKDRPLILGGVVIDHPLGLAGHSDADVLTHAVMDGLLGAAGMGDIGRHFPDTDQAYKDINSLTLLRHVSDLLTESGWGIVNVDSVIMAQKPKLAPLITKMEQTLAEAMGVDPIRVHIKATTTEKLGFVGREEGIAAQSCVLIAATSRSS